MRSFLCLTTTFWRSGKNITKTREVLKDYILDHAGLVKTTDLDMTELTVEDEELPLFDDNILAREPMLGTHGVPLKAALGTDLMIDKMQIKAMDTRGIASTAMAICG